MADVIEGEVSKWIRSRQDVSSAQDINNGDCRAFANGVREIIHEHVDEEADIRVREYGYDSSGYTSGAHVWLEYEGRHYDAECPSGVSSVEELPIFRRMGVSP